MESSQLGWKKLRCDCGSEHFTLTFHVNWKEGGGTSTAPAGYKCAQCDMISDAKYLVDRAMYKQRREDLKRMQEELEAEGTLPTAKTVKEEQDAVRGR